MMRDIDVGPIGKRCPNNSVETQPTIAVHITSVHVWADTRIFQRMCCGLGRRGWGVVLVAANAPCEVVDDIRVVGVRVPRNRLLRVLLGGLAVTFRAALIRSDLYQIHDPELLLWSWILRLKGTPVVFDMHEHAASAIMTKPWIPAPLRPVVRACWNAIERVTLGWCAVIFAESSYAKHYPWVKRCATVLNLPDLQVLLNIESCGYKADLVYVGRVSESRGSIAVLKALELLRRSGREATYLCVGETSSAHADQLHSVVGQMRLNGVELLGYRKPIDAWAIAKGCRVGLAVLMPEPNYMESYPTKMFEYMALGLPVIASDFPLYRDVVARHECGLCVDPTAPESIATAISTLLADPEKAHAMGANGRRVVSTHYDWQRQLDQLETLYASCGVRRHQTGNAMDLPGVHKG